MKRRLVEKHPIWAWIIIFCISIGLSIFALSTRYLDNLMSTQHGANYEEIDVILLFLAGMATVALVLVAYIEIHHINKNNRAEFLLRIDERWTSRKILKARTIIYNPRPKRN